MSQETNYRWYGALDSWLDRLAQKRADMYVAHYAKKEDGTTDELLEKRIRFEIGRRAELGKTLDIYEPIRWTGIRAVLGIAGAGVAKLVTNRLSGNAKTVGFGVEIGLVVATIINSAIDLTRLLPRYLSGLSAGKDIAIKAHETQEMLPYAHLPSTEIDTHALQRDVNTTKEHQAELVIAKPYSHIQPTSLIRQAERKEVVTTNEIS